MFVLLCSLTLFTLFDAKFKFLVSVLTFILGGIPIIADYVVCVPFAIAFIINGQYGTGLIFFLLHYTLFSLSTSYMLFNTTTNEVTPSPLVTGLSLWLGVTVFGIQGVILGPLLVCVGIVFHQEFSSYVLHTQNADLFEPLTKLRTPTRVL